MPTSPSVSEVRSAFCKLFHSLIFSTTSDEFKESIPVHTVCVFNEKSLFYIKFHKVAEASVVYSALVKLLAL